MAADHRMSFEPVEKFKITVFGSGGVGKSTLTIRLVSDQFVDVYDPTIEDSYQYQCDVDNNVVMMEILDTAGQEEFRSMKDEQIRDGQGFLLVYSITSKQSLQECERLRDEIKAIKDGSEDPFAIVLVGNKCDLEDQRVVEYDEGKKWADNWQVPFYETSAKSKINNKECYFELVRLLYKKRHPEPKKDLKKRRKTSFKKFIVDNKKKCTLL